MGDLKFVDLDRTELNRQLLQRGDILFNRTNSIDLVGKDWVVEGIRTSSSCCVLFDTCSS